MPNLVTTYVRFVAAFAVFNTEIKTAPPTSKPTNSKGFIINVLCLLFLTVFSFLRNGAAGDAAPVIVVTSTQKKNTSKKKIFRKSGGKLTEDLIFGQLLIGLCNWLELDLVSPFEKVKQAFLGD